MFWKYAGKIPPEVGDLYVTNSQIAKDWRKSKAWYAFQTDPIANKTEIRSTEAFLNLVIVDQAFEVCEIFPDEIMPPRQISLDGYCWSIEMIVLNASKETILQQGRVIMHRSILRLLHPHMSNQNTQSFLYTAYMTYISLCIIIQYSTF